MIISSSFRTNLHTPSAFSCARHMKIERKHCRRVYLEAYTDMVANVYDKGYAVHTT